MLKVGLKIFLALTPSVKRALVFFPGLSVALSIVSALLNLTKCVFNYIAPIINLQQNILQ